MTISGINGYAGVAAAQAQWDAIASIKSTSPFQESREANQSAAVSDALDSIMDTHGTVSTALDAASVSSQPTIDLYA